MRKSVVIPLILCLCGLTTGHIFGCTIIMAAKNGLVLAGNNEDRNFLETRVSFLPSTPNFYGRVVFGFSDAPGQGGMNDQGLMIDGNRIAPTGWQPQAGKPTFRGHVIMYILGKCATVDDVKAFFEKYNHPSLSRARFPIADRSGASMVVEYAKGKVQFVRSKKWYQIATNFLKTTVSNGRYPCWRYNTADRLLKGSEILNPDLMHDVLRACKQKTGSLTVYSNIYDLKKQTIYLYNLSDFENRVVIQLADELKKGDRTLPLAELFGERSKAEYSADPLIIE